jgi:hypothetical protein
LRPSPILYFSLSYLKANPIIPILIIITNRHKLHSQLLLLLILHPLHNPPTRLLRILLRLLLILHRLLHLREVVRHIHALVHRRPLLNRLQPGLDLRECRGFDARPFAPVDPREDADVGKGVLVADKVGGFAGGNGVGFAFGGEAVVEDLVEAFGFGLVAIDSVGDFFGGV